VALTLPDNERVMAAALRALQLIAKSDIALGKDLVYHYSKFIPYINKYRARDGIAVLSSLVRSFNRNRFFADPHFGISLDLIVNLICMLISEHW
jgi:hypothetical protein